MRVAICLALSFLAGPAMALWESRARGDDGLVLVLHPPWVDGSKLAQHAGARMIGPEQPRMGTLVHVVQGGLDDLAGAHGTWFVLDATRLAAICGVNA